MREGIPLPKARAKLTATGKQASLRTALQRKKVRKNCSR